MSTDYGEGDPSITPSWERILLIGELQECLTDHSAQAAIAVSTELDILTVLRGNIFGLPSRQGLDPTLTIVHLDSPATASFIQLRAQHLGRDPSPIFQNFDVNPSQETLEELTQRDGLGDEICRFLLSQVIFRKEAAECVLDQYLRIPKLLGKALGSNVAAKYIQVVDPVS